MMLVTACELYRDAGFIGQPAAAVTSLAFVIAGLAVVARRPHGAPTVIYGLLVVAVGAGSLVAHGPNRLGRPTHTTFRSRHCSPTSPSTPPPTGSAVDCRRCGGSSSRS